MSLTRHVRSKDGGVELRTSLKFKLDLSVKIGSIDYAALELVDYAAYGDRVYYVTRHRLANSGANFNVWRSCDEYLSDVRNVDSPEWSGHNDFVRFSAKSDPGFPLVAIGKDVPDYGLSQQRAVLMTDDARHRFVSVRAPTHPTAATSYFVTTVGGSQRLCRFDERAMKIDGVFDPSLTNDIAIGEYGRTKSYSKRSVVTSILYTVCDKGVFVIATHKQCGEWFETWRRLSAELEDERDVRYPIDWPVGNAKKFFVSDSDGLRVIGKDGRVIQYKIAPGEGVIYEFS